MKTTIIISVIGVIGFTEDGKITEKILFKKDPYYIAEKLSSTEAGTIISELTSAIKKLKKKDCDVLVFENDSLAKAVKDEFKIETKVVHRSPQGENLRQEIERFAVDVGFMEESEPFRKLIREVSLELTRMRVKKAGEKKDFMVVQAILSIDDLDKTINLFMGRIREWYGLHFPELDNITEKHEIYAKLVVELGDRQNFTKKNLTQLDLQENVVKKIAEAAQNSIGAELSKEDINQIQALCKQTLDMYNLRKTLQVYADTTVAEVAPNTKAIVGSLLAARLIALAGSLENLAKMPASTIQVLGAEKALFRALKTGSKPPKHGVIFQDTSIHDSKKWQRGKTSRALAGKLAIAARSDAFSKRYIGDSLKADLKKRIEEIKEKYQKPSQKKPKVVSKHPRKKRRKKRGYKR